MELNLDTASESEIIEAAQQEGYPLGFVYVDNQLVQLVDSATARTLRQEANKRLVALQKQGDSSVIKLPAISLGAWEL